MSSKKRKRREAISALVLEQGAATVGSLAEQLNVSMQTIRRDVEVLCEDDMMHRVHGRIELSKEFLNTPFNQRTDTNPLGKQAIGEAAARLIPDGSTLFMSIGSTPLSVAHALHKRKNLTVITNNLNVALAMSDEPSNRIIIPEGELRLPDRDILGDEVLEFFGRYRAEFAIFGVAGVELDGRLLEFHSAECRVREKIRANAQKSLLVVDQSKFGRRAPALSGNISEIDTIIMDRRPGSAFTPLLEPIENRLVIAEGEMK
jgi:DeoR family glycerol-3-phosphate regulon repressor